MGGGLKKLKIDMSSEAVDLRLKQVEQLRRTCLELAKLRVGKTTTANQIQKNIFTTPSNQTQPGQQSTGNSSENK